jgi:tetratricopeptide (TPR) repeat protein
VKKIKIKHHEEKIAGKEFNAVDYFNLNKSKMINIAITVVVFVFAVTAIFIWQGNKRENAALLIIQAKDLFYNGKYDAALSDYTRFIKEYPKSNFAPSAYLGLAYCHEQLKNFDEAKKNYAEVQRKFPHSAWAVDAGKGIERLS